jgi:hypothetical protein
MNTWSTCTLIAEPPTTQKYGKADDTEPEHDTEEQRDRFVVAAHVPKERMLPEAARHQRQHGKHRPYREGTANDGYGLEHSSTLYNHRLTAMREPARLVSGGRTTTFLRCTTNTPTVS